MKGAGEKRWNHADVKNAWIVRGRAACYHADVVVHKPPAVDFAAVGLQYVLTQGDGQVIIKQPNVPKKICQTDCMTEVIVHFQKIN
jgi:hypothetical protein